MADELARVNVDEGFLPQFAPSFLAHYGPESLFVRATSDAYTLALARMMAATGRLRNAQSVRFFACEEATEVLLEVLRAVDGLKQLLLHEATGYVELGTVERKVDASLGSGVFRTWRAAFEISDYDTCRRLTSRCRCNE
jgi:hypothetical protein